MPATIKDFNNAASAVSKMMMTGERLGWSLKKVGKRGWNVRDRSTNNPASKRKHHIRLIDVVDFISLIPDPAGGYWLCPPNKEIQTVGGDITFSLVRFDDVEFSLIAIKGDAPKAIPTNATGFTQACCCSKPECQAKEAALRAADLD